MSDFTEPPETLETSIPEPVAPEDEKASPTPTEASAAAAPQAVDLDDLRQELTNADKNNPPVDQDPTITPEQQKNDQRIEDIKLKTQEAVELGKIYGKDCQNFGQLDSLLGQIGASPENMEKLAIEMEITDAEPAVRAQKVQENLGRLHVEINAAAEEIAQAFVDLLPEGLQMDGEKAQAILKDELQLTDEQMAAAIKDPSAIKDIIKQHIPLAILFDKVIDRDEKKTAGVTSNPPDTSAAGGDGGGGPAVAEAEAPKSFKEKVADMIGTTAYNELVLYGGENFSNALDMFFANHPSQAARRGGEFPDSDESLAQQGKQVNEEIMDSLILKGDRDKTNKLIKALIKPLSGVPLGETTALITELTTSDNPQELFHSHPEKCDAFMALFNERAGGAMIVALAEWIVSSESGSESDQGWKDSYNKFIHQDGAHIPYGITRQALEKFKTRASQA